MRGVKMGRKVSREYNSNHKRGVQARGGLGRRRLFGGSGMWWIEIHACARARRDRRLY